MITQTQTMVRYNNKKEKRRRKVNVPIKVFLIILYTATIYIAYLSYNKLTKHDEQQQDHSIHIGGGWTSLRLATFFDKPEGFCPTTSCKIGKTRIREAFQQAPEAISAVKSNPANEFITAHVDEFITLKMMIRDPLLDNIISGKLALGETHEPHIKNLVVRCLEGKQHAIFIDVGANIGYFTAIALAIGATVISFEPFYENAGVLMSTIQQNYGWKDRSTLYMNAVGYESTRVTMASTNEDINLSNMHVTGSQCVTNNDSAYHKGKYGRDYMDTVSLDQVLFANHRDIKRVQLMKVDVETFELQVLQGAMQSMCNMIIERITVEVEYYKPIHNMHNPCDFERLRAIMIDMGYEIVDIYHTEEKDDMTYWKLSDMPPDILFRLKDMSVSPADRLRKKRNNACKKFDMLSSKRIS